MSVTIFVIGVLVFLITVYGAVMAGGLLLTESQLDQHPELEPDAPSQTDDGSNTDRARRVISAEF